MASLKLASLKVNSYSTSLDTGKQPVKLWKYWYKKDNEITVLTQILCIKPERTSVWKTLHTYLNTGKANEIGFELI